MNDTTFDDRFRRVLGHIDAHLDDVPSLDELASVACYSPFHFHRRFSALTGLSVHRYVQLLRFKRAAWQAAFRPGVSITRMAMDAGYESAEAFSRAFSQRLGRSPSEFRTSPDWSRWTLAWADIDRVRRFHMARHHDLGAVRIVEVPHITVARLRHQGDPSLIGHTIQRFIAWRRLHGLHPSRSATWNVVYADPEATPPDEYRMDLCVTCGHVEANADGVVADTIEGGRCAVLRHVGPDSQLADSVRFLYGEWLSATGEVPRDAPLFWQRVMFFPDVPEHEAVTDIYLPLQGG
jgi:AraC family transcriptional regulator